MLTTLGSRLRHLRKIKGDRQADFAKVCGVTRLAVSHWERCTSEPTISNLVAIAEHYGTAYRWLLTGQGEIAPPGHDHPAVTMDREKIVREVVRNHIDATRGEIETMLKEAGL